MSLFCFSCHKKSANNYQRSTKIFGTKNIFKKNSVWKNSLVSKFLQPNKYYGQKCFAQIHILIKWFFSSFFLEICPRSTWDLSKICFWFAWPLDMPDICLNFTWDKPGMFLRYAWDLCWDLLYLLSSIQGLALLTYKISVYLVFNKWKLNLGPTHVKVTV